MRGGIVLLLVCAAVACCAAGARAQTSATVTATSGFSFSPASVTVAPGATVTFQYAGGGPAHNVSFAADPRPSSCSASLPAAPTTAAWSGDCTFAGVGTYRFACDLHGPAMSGTVEVTADGRPTAPPPPPPPPGGPRPPAPGGGTPTTPATGTPAPGGGSGGGDPYGGSGTGAPGATGGEPGAGAPGGEAPRGGSRAPAALTLATSQSGPRVRGSIAVGPRRARLLVELRRPGSGLLVGQLRRASAGPGRVAFTVVLSRAGRRALRRAGRLTVRVRIAVTPPGARTGVRVRTVVLSSLTR
jgi:plastocyanin